MSATERMRARVEAAARASHEANRAYCIAIGDTSQEPWELAPTWQQESAIKGATFVLETIASGRIPRPEASHENWLAEKIAAGWKYGPIKDPAKREHPCITSYANLPPEQRAKDALFIATVRAVAEALEEAGDVGGHFDANEAQR